MTSLSLAGQTILLTGGLGALAEHLLKKLSGAGANLVVTDILSPDQATQKFRSWDISPDRCTYLPMDVTVMADVESVLSQVFERFPRCDTVIGHAGGCDLHDFARTEAKTFERIFRFNFLAQANLARAVLGHWTSADIPGHLIFTSSYVATVPHRGISAYASAKAALENFARCLALEYATAGVRVNCVAPGNVAAGSSLRVYEENSEYRTFVDQVTPNGRRNSPQGVADAYLFLCSSLAAEWNGQTLHVDHGLTIPKIG